MKLKLKPNVSWFLIPILAVIALAIAYYLVIFLPSKEKMRNELEKEKIRLESEALKEKKAKLNECFAHVEARYNKNWDEAVKLRDNKDGTLPVDLAKRFDDFRKYEQELCVKKYK